MCLSKLIKRVSKKPPVVIPFPEQPADYSRTVDNVQASDLLLFWLALYHVTAEYHQFWQTDLTLHISMQFQVPAATSSETMTIWIRPEWSNPGTLAHEVSHISYYLLPDKDKAAWQKDYEYALKNDSLVQVLAKQNQYMHSSLIEAHAEIYRYLGSHMPVYLFRYYPKLLKEV